MTVKHILTELENGVLTITFSRPEKKNAITAEMYQDMIDALIRSEKDEGIKVAVITGSHGNFTSGNDLQDFIESPPTDENSAPYKFLRCIAQLTVPLIAAVDGMSIGIGTTMLLHCDFVYATPRTIFRLPFVNLGLIPEAGATMLLPRLVGHMRAAELLMLGEPFDANVASQLGLVSRVFEPTALLDQTRKTAYQLASKPRSAISQTKRLLRMPDESILERIHRESLIFTECLQSKEAKEAMTAILSKIKTPKE